MARKQSTLEMMRANPRKDWQIKDIEKLCDQLGMELRPPSKGSHFKVCSPYIRDILTIPAKRPIKPFYIKSLVSFADAHCGYKEDQSDG